MGKVYFIGAGPHDSAFITMQGYEILKEADCVLYDHLLDEEFLSIAKGKCIYVGKQAGQHSMPQEDINALLIACAKQYDMVVRLKGGDSVVFGRGGEEGQALYEAGISFSFLPGVTSAIAALEMAGIPITHRGIADGFQVLSAHYQNHSLQIEPDQLTNPRITTVFLMGLSRIKEICTLLRQANRTNSTKIAIIMQGCSPTQEVICATLATIEETMRTRELKFPGIVVVGEVVGLRKQLAFYEHLPLYGRNILVTKVQKEQSPLTPLLKKQGAKVVEVQCGEIHYLEVVNLSNALHNCQRILFTSRHGVHGFFNCVMQFGDARRLAGKSIYAIGKKTAMALQEYGICADDIAQGDAMKLAQLLQKESTTLLYCKGNLAHALNVEEFSFPIEECIVYEQEKIPQKNIDISAYDTICFSCASSVAQFAQTIEDMCCVSIGPATTKALQKRKVKHIIEAASPSYEAMAVRIIEEDSKCIEEED